MEGNKTIMLLLLAGSILFASVACTREEWNVPAQENSAGIPVSLSLSVAEMEAGTPETKAIMEPDIDSPSLKQQVKNFVVLQFEGSGNDAKLVALPKYYNDAASIFNGTEQIRLLPSNTTNTIVVVANTFDNIYAQSGMTLGQFLNWDYTRMNGYESVFTRDTDGNDYLRMSGSATEGQITTTTSINLSLKRNVSKITIKVINNDTDVTLQHAQLRDINAKYYYLTNFDNFVDNYSGVDPCRLDKEPEEWTNGKKEQTFEYYVPTNMRGTNGSKFQYTKGLGAPEGATRFCLYGTYGSGENRTDINYTYYLGGNLENDFDLKPNFHYTYNIEIFANSKENVHTDYRIEDCKEIKFLVDANCYMVQPPVGHGQSRIYAIPIHRIATFWNKPTDGNDGVYGARGNNPSLRFNNGASWDAEVLWSDFVLDPADFLDKNAGVGYNDYFKIRIKEGMKGNVVVAVKNGDAVIWSWHIWITDYNPDREKLVPASGTFVYGVEGGNVHRYNNTIFNSGDYKNGFIMDRNLGASSASFAGLNGAMYYQFGRKDPFIGYYQEGNTQTYYTYTSEGVKKENVQTVGRAEAGSDSQNVRYAVSNPTVFIYVPKGEKANQDWTSGDPFGPNQSTWLDAKYLEHTGDQKVLEKNKSIYDPCPPGWKVPAMAVFENIISNMKKASDGFNYSPVNGINLYFPQHSFIDPLSGRFCNQYLKTNGKLWSADPVIYDGGNCGKALDYQNSAKISSYYQAFAFPVRCVREGAYVRENYIAD